MNIGIDVHLGYGCQTVVPTMPTIAISYVWSFRFFQQDSDWIERQFMSGVSFIMCTSCRLNSQTKLMISFVNIA